MAISKYKALGGLYLEGQFNGGFFALQVRGAYIWRGLFSEFYGILISALFMTNSIKKYILLGFSFEKHDKMLSSLYLSLKLSTHVSTACIWVSWLKI